MWIAARENAGEAVEEREGVREQGRGRGQEGVRSGALYWVCPVCVGHSQTLPALV